MNCTLEKWKKINGIYTHYALDVKWLRLKLFKDGQRISIFKIYQII